MVEAEKELVTSERALKDAIDKFGGNSTQANLLRMERNAKIVKVDSVKGVLAKAEEPIKLAEAALKVAQNAVIAENRLRKEVFAGEVESGTLQKISFALRGVGESGRMEAANKMRAGIKEEKK